MDTSGPDSAIEGLRHAARLASALARPFATLDPASCRLGGLSAGEIAGLARDRSFRRPLERAILSSNGLDSLTLAAQTVRPASDASADRRLAMTIVTDPMERLRQAGLLLAGGVMQRHVLQLAHKLDRQRLRAVLGEEVHRVATQEAPTLFPGLAMPAAHPILDGAMDGARPPEVARGAIVDFGLGLLHRFVALAAPDLSHLMRHRLPETARSAEIAAIAATADERQARQFTRFLRRRVQEWSATTG